MKFPPSRMLYLMAWMTIGVGILSIIKEDYLAFLLAQMIALILVISGTVMEDRQ